MPYVTSRAVMFPLDARVYRRTAVRRRDLMVCGCVREGWPSEAKARYGGIPNGTIGRGCGENSAAQGKSTTGKSTTGAEAHTDSLSFTRPCAGRFSVFPQPLKSCPSRLGAPVVLCGGAGLKVRGRDGHATAGWMPALRAGRRPDDRRWRLSPHHLLSLPSISAVRALQCPYGDLSSRGGCRSQPWKGPGGGRGRIGLR